MNDELLPCPFCGERIGVSLRQAWRYMENDPRKNDWCVDCEDCGANSGCFGGKESARKWWNRRAPLAAHPPVQDTQDAKDAQ